MTHTFTAANGRKYLVRLVKQGDRYGPKGRLQHDSANPMLEFYLATESRVNDLGWLYPASGWVFVSRYYVDTLLGQSDYSNGDFRTQGMCLDGAYPEYNLTPDDCKEAAKILAEFWP